MLTPDTTETLERLLATHSVSEMTPNFVQRLQSAAREVLDTHKPQVLPGVKPATVLPPRKS